MHSAEIESFCMKSGTALRAVGAGWLRTKVVESGLPAGRDREVLNSGLLLAFSEIEVRDRVQLVPLADRAKLCERRHGTYCTL